MSYTPNSIHVKLDKLRALSHKIYEQELTPQEQTAHYSGLYVLMVGYFEKYVTERLKSVDSSKDELKLLSVLKGIKNNLAAAKDISINDLMSWHKNEGENITKYFVRHADRVNELQVFLTLKADHQKKDFNQLITDYKQIVARHRNEIAHGEDENIDATDFEKFSTAYSLVVSIIDFIQNN